MSKEQLKLATVIVAAIYSLYYFASLPAWHFIDNVNLIIHEAGHVVFLPFGHFISVAGGSLLQIVMPALFVWYFFRTQQMYSALLISFWVAINFFSVALYASDAQLMQLPLLGGDSSGHDWNYILSTLGLLNQTKIISGFIYLLGIATIFGAIYLAINSYYIEKKAGN